MPNNSNMKNTNAPQSQRDARLEEALSELRQVELPPFYRARLLARVRAARGRSPWAERLRSPQFAWSVTAVSVAALVVVAVMIGTRGSPPGTAVPVAGPTSAYASTLIEPVMPADNSVVGVGDVEIVAAIEPPVAGALIRLFVDEVDVTGLAEVTDSYVMYSPGESLTEGEHIITIEIRDASGVTVKDASWLFYAMNGRHEGPDERV